MTPRFFATEATEIIEEDFDCGMRAATPNMKNGCDLKPRATLAAIHAHRARSSLCALCVLCGLMTFPGDMIAAPQPVVPVDGAAFSAELFSITAAGDVRFKVDGQTEPVVLKLNDLVRWGHPVALRAQTIVVLADGGRLVTAADWSGGAAVQLKGDDVVVVSDAWDEVKVPRERVVGVVFAQQRSVVERETLVEEVGKRGGDPAAEAASPADGVRLGNGDRLVGELSSLEKGSVTLKTAAGETKLPLSRVEAIVLGRQAADGESVARGARFAVGMRDGSLLYAKSIVADQGKATIELANGVKLSGGRVSDIVAVQSLGGRIEYLSDIERADYRFVPYLSIAWPLARDRNVLNGPLVVDGKRYWKGLGLHSAARATYKLDQTYRRFEASIALDDAAKERGSVVCGAYVQRDGKWAEAFKSGTVRGGDSPRAVSIDLQGAQGLTLTVDFADRGDELDYADWLDARLIQ